MAVLRRDHGRDHAARVDRLDAPPLIRTGQTVEVPPRDAVLRGDDAGARPQQRREQRRPRPRSCTPSARGTRCRPDRSRPGSSVACGCAWKSPRGLSTVTPRSRMAARCSPRAIRWTSAPPRSSAAPTYAPIAPAPTTATFTRRPPARPGSAAGSCPSAPSGSRGRIVTRTGRLNAARRSAQYEVSSRGVASPLEHDDDAHLLAVLLVRHRVGRRLGDRGMGEQHVLDLVGRDLLSGPVDQLLHPAHQREVAVGTEPARRRRCGTSRRGTRPPSPRDCRGTRRRRTGRAPRPRPPRPPAPAASRRRARRPRCRSPSPTVPGRRSRGRQRVGRHLMRRLGHPVRLDERDADRFLVAPPQAVGSGAEQDRTKRRR